ncbi:unnamed protein product, partial [Gordionus sp. m RMFG-2023]
DEDNEFECSGVLNIHTQDVKSVSWHSTLDILLSCGYDDTCKLHHCPSSNLNSVGEWETITSLDAHTSTVWSAKFQPNIGQSEVLGDLDQSEVTTIDEKNFDRLIATCGADKSLKIWACNGKIDSGQWKLINSYDNLHTRAIYDLDWHPTLNIIATCGADNTIILTTLDHNSKPHQGGDVEESCVGKTYVDSNFIAPKPYKLSNAHSEDINAIRWNPKHHDLVATCSDDSTIKIWRLVFQEDSK